MPLSDDQSGGKATRKPIAPGLLGGSYRRTRGVAPVPRASRPQIYNAGASSATNRSCGVRLLAKLR